MVKSRFPRFPAPVLWLLLSVGLLSPGAARAAASPAAEMPINRARFLTAQADAGPLQVVRSSNERILGLFAAGGDTPETRRRVYAVMDEVTDFGVLSGRAIERFCADIPPTKCREFKDTFTELLRARAVARAGRYKADRFDYLGEEIDGDHAVVRTIAYYEDENVTLDYELERLDGRWKIVNYVVEGIDTVRSYQKQFMRLLRKETVDDVITRLRTKIAEYENETESKRAG